jgi:hypothetical protein
MRELPQTRTVNFAGLAVNVKKSAQWNPAKFTKAEIHRLLIPTAARNS